MIVLAGCSSPEVLTATDPSTIKFSFTLIAGILAGVYEVLARAIPTIKNYSFIAKIIEILVWLSKFLNRKKK